MAERKTEQEVREGLAVELQKHVQLLKLEFDKVESIVKHAYRMECDNEEIKELQNLKDAKMTLIRIRYHHETNLAVQEFKDKVEEVLRRDARGYSNRASARDSLNNQGGKDSDIRNRADGDARERDVNQGSKNTERRSLTQRTRSRKKVKDLRHEDIDAERAANVELSKQFLESLKNEPKENSDNDGTANRGGNGKRPKVQERRLGKIVVKTGRNRGIVIKDKAGSSAEHAQENKSSFEQRTNMRRNFTRNESFKAEQESIAQDVPTQKLKRRRVGNGGPNDVEGPKEEENPHGKIRGVFNTDAKILDVENVRPSKEDGGESNIPGQNENNARTKKAVETKSVAGNEHDLRGTPKRRRGRKPTMNKESAAPEEPAEEKQSKKRKVTASGNSRRTAGNAASSSTQDQRGGSNTPVADETEAERNQQPREGGAARQEQEVEEVPVSNLRRSKRQRRPTAKARAGKLY